MGLQNKITDFYHLAGKGRNSGEENEIEGKGEREIRVAVKRSVLRLILPQKNPRATYGISVNLSLFGYMPAVA